MLRRFIVLGFACFLTAFVAGGRPLPEIKKSGVLKIAMDGGTPGFNYYENGKTLTGFEVELAQDLARRLNLKVEWAVQPFGTLLVGLSQDRFDVIGTGLTITPERKKTFDFVAPTYCSGGTVFSKTGGPKTLADLAGKTVSVPVGTVYYEQLKKNTTIKKLKTVPGEANGLQEVLSGTSDAWVTDQFIGLAALKNHPELQMGDRVLNQDNAMVVSKNSSELKSLLDAELEKAKQDGTFARLSKKYFARDIRCGS